VDPRALSPEMALGRGRFGVQYLSDEFCLSHRPDELDCLVDDSLGDPGDVVLVGQMGKLDGLDHIGTDEVRLYRRPVRQANCLGAIGSGGCDQNLNMDRFRKSGELLARGMSQP